jgi:hypothetical protein
LGGGHRAGPAAWHEWWAGEYRTRKGHGQVDRKAPSEGQGETCGSQAGREAGFGKNGERASARPPAAGAAHTYRQQDRIDFARRSPTGLAALGKRGACSGT